LGYLITQFKLGGPVMYFILLVMIAGIAIIVERIIYVLVKNKIDTTAFINRVLEFVQRDNLKSAMEFCNMSAAALPKITRAGLEEAGKSAADIQNAFELAALVEIAKLEKRTQYLSTLANVATLLGLLGTIFGLITAFEAVSAADASVKSAILSRGISEAMITTAFGLIVAIPCLAAYAVLQEKTNELVDEINQNVSRVYRRLINVRGR